MVWSGVVWYSINSKTMTYLLLWNNLDTTRGKLVNHLPPARDLQALQALIVFSQYPVWVYYAGKQIENAVYCLIQLLH